MVAASAERPLLSAALPSAGSGPVNRNVKQAFEPAGPGGLPVARTDSLRTLIKAMNAVGTARCAVRAAFSGATVPPAIARAGTSQRDVPTRVWFMEREHLQNLDVSWGYEPAPSPGLRPP